MDMQPLEEVNNMEPISIKAFRKKHNCKSCFYYTKMKRCVMTLECPLDVNTERSSTKKSCPLDIDGTCPYKNEAGTCFGFCMKEILREHRERKRQNEQTKEEKEDG